VHISQLWLHDHQSAVDHVTIGQLWTMWLSVRCGPCDYQSAVDHVAISQLWITGPSISCGPSCDHQSAVDHVANSQLWTIWPSVSCGPCGHQSAVDHVTISQSAVVERESPIFPRDKKCSDMKFRDVMYSNVLIKSPFKGQDQLKSEGKNMLYSIVCYWMGNQSKMQDFGEFSIV
jgi:hypothetical protein